MSLCELCNKEKAQEKIEGIKMCEMCATHLSYSGLLAHERLILSLKEKVGKQSLIIMSLSWVAFVEAVVLLFKIFL